MRTVTKGGHFVRVCDLCGRVISDENQSDKKRPSTAIGAKTYYIELGIDRIVPSDRKYRGTNIGRTSAYKLVAVGSVCQDCFDRLVFKVNNTTIPEEVTEAHVEED